MAEQRTASLMGRIAVHNKLISMQQLAEATAEQGRNPEKNIGVILVEKGFISPGQLQQLAATQKKIVARQRAQQALEAQTAQRGSEARKPAASPEREARKPAASAPPPAAAVPSAPATAAPVPVATPAPAAATQPEPEPDAGPASLGFRTTAASPQDRERLHQILRDAVGAGASDIHVHSGAALKQRLHGTLTECGSTPIVPEEAERLALAGLSDAERHVLERQGELDLCYTAEGIGRFRTNVYRQHRGFDAVFRAIPAEASSLEQLGLPNALAKHTPAYRPSSATSRW